MMARPYQELRDKMGPERQARVDRRVARSVVWIILRRLIMQDVRNVGTTVAELFFAIWKVIRMHTRSKE